jgi:charged multivesicular body protein 4
MLSFFSKPGAAAQTPRDAIMRLRESIETMEKREEYLQHKAEAETAAARMHLAAARRPAAANALRRRKLIDDQIEKLGRARMTLEAQAFSLENAVLTSTAVASMRAASNTLGEMNTRADAKNIDTTMEDLRDHIDVAEQMSSLLGEPINAALDDVDDELDDILADMAVGTVHLPPGGAAAAVELPPVPTAPLPALAPAERAVVEELRRSMMTG